MAACRLLCALLLLLAGCMGDVRRKAEPPPERTPEATAESVFIDAALVEQPLGDEFLTRGLWDAGDEQLVSLEQLPVLENNGLRACRLGGMLPSRLQALLTSKRSCPQPRRLRTVPGKAVNFAVGPRRGSCEFELHTVGGTVAVKLEGVQCGFEILPNVTGEGELVLRLQPQATLDESRRRPGAERTPAGALRWALEEKPPTEEYQELAFDVAVAPGEFIAIGPGMSRPGTLGPAWFLGEGDNGAVQRVLILRAVRVVGSREEVEERRGPVALQAGRLAVRGVSP